MNELVQLPTAFQYSYCVAMGSLHVYSLRFANIESCTVMLLQVIAIFKRARRCCFIRSADVPCIQHGAWGGLFPYVVNVQDAHMRHMGAGINYHVYMFAASCSCSSDLQLVAFVRPEAGPSCVVTQIQHACKTTSKS